MGPEAFEVPDVAPVLEIHPADHGGDGCVIVREIEKEIGFFNGGCGLHQDRPVYMETAEQGLEVMRQVVPAERREGLA
jgi:hypothetical protein